MKLTLLEAIRQFWQLVGSEVSDLELTDLIHERGELVDHGFKFLRLSNDFALFSVPEQDPNKCRGETTWLSPEKEKTARTIAGKYHLEIYEPPDDAGLFRIHRNRHHFDFTCPLGPVVIAHPQYLKVRLSRKPLYLEQDLLSELASLYA
jgi:hypothetical protein